MHACITSVACVCMYMFTCVQENMDGCLHTCGWYRLISFSQVFTVLLTELIKTSHLSQSLTISLIQIITLLCGIPSLKFLSPGITSRFLFLPLFDFSAEFRNFSPYVSVAKYITHWDFSSVFHFILSIWVTNGTPFFSVLVSGSTCNDKYIKSTHSVFKTALPEHKRTHLYFSVIYFIYYSK